MTDQLIPLKHTLKQACKFQIISDKILLNLKSIPDLETHKLSIELIEYICNLIEYYTKKKYKIDKQNLFIYTMKRIVTLSEDDIETIKQAIQYLHDNKLIKVISTVSKVLLFTKNVIKNKII